MTDKVIDPIIVIQTHHGPVLLENATRDQLISAIHRLTYDQEKLRETAAKLHIIIRARHASTTQP